LLSVASETYLEKVSQAPNSVSSDLGQLAVNRHLISGIDCAIAGAATADPAIPAPATLRNSRRFMGVFLLITGAGTCNAAPWVTLGLTSSPRG